MSIDIKGLRLVVVLVVGEIEFQLKFEFRIGRIVGYDEDKWSRVM